MTASSTSAGQRAAVSVCTSTLQGIGRPCSLWACDQTVVDPHTVQPALTPGLPRATVMLRTSAIPRCALLAAARAAATPCHDRAPVQLCAFHWKLRVVCKTDRAGCHRAQNLLHYRSHVPHGKPCRRGLPSATTGLHATAHVTLCAAAVRWAPLRMRSFFYMQPFSCGKLRNARQPFRAWVDRAGCVGV